MAEVNTSSYGIVQQPAAMDAFSRAFAGAQNARVQQEAQQSLIEERKAQTAEIARKTAEAQRAAFEEDTLTKLFGSGQPVDPKSVYSVVGPKRGADILKGISALQEQDLKTETAMREHVGTMTGAILALPEGMRPQAYGITRNNLIQKGYLKPEELPEQYAPETVAAARKWALTPKDQFEQEAQAARDAIAAKKAAAELPGITADAAVKAQVAAGTVGGMTPEQQRTAKTAAGQLGVAQGNLAVARQREKREQGKEDLMTGAGVGPDGKPLPENPVARGIAENRIPPPSARSLATGPGQALMRQVQAINPTYDATKFPERQRTRIAFTTGTQGQQIDAMNTAVQHLHLLGEAADALKNGTFVPGNALYNKIATTFGAAGPMNLNTINEMVHGEVGAVIKKGGATEGEMNRQALNAGAASSPEQMSGYINSAIPLMASKIHTLNYKAAQSLGDKDPLVAGMLMPEVRTILQARGFNADGTPKGGGDTKSAGVIRARDPQGKLHEAPAGTALPAGWTKEGG